MEIAIELELYKVRQTGMYWDLCWTETLNPRDEQMSKTYSFLSEELIYLGRGLLFPQIQVAK